MPQKCKQLTALGSMNKNFHVLLLEDVPTDAKLIEHELLKGAFPFVLKRVTTEEAFQKALKKFKPDIILADYKLPKFDGISALQIVKKNHPDIPFIFVSGYIGEELAIETLKNGAKDYVLKDNLSRLVPSVRRALNDYEEQTKRKQSEEALQKSEEKYRNLVNEINDGIFVLNDRRIFAFANKPLAFIYGMDTPDELVGKTIEEFVTPDARDKIMKIFSRFARTGKISGSIEVPIMKKDKSLTFLEIKPVPIIKDGKITGTRGVVREITERKRAEEELRMHKIELEMQNEELRSAQIKVENLLNNYSDLYDFAPVSYFTFDKNGLIIEVNLTGSQKLGKERSSLIKKPFFLYVVPADNDLFYLHLRQVFRTESRQTCEIKLMSKNGVQFYAQLESIPVRNIDGDFNQCRTAITDITDRKRIEEKIKHMAFHDALTSLPNRILFNDRLTLALAHAHRNKEMLAVLFLDLDRFKGINDALGHTMGDQLLRSVADRLKSCIRDEDTVARFAGDEFTLLLLGITQAEHVISLARKLLDALKQPLMINGHELYITASIGIAVYPDDGRDAETLLKNADTAMYHAKEQGKNNFQFYTPAMHAKSFEKMVLESTLRRALDREEFVVYYQPLVNIGTGEMTGMEALVRWQHPDRGLIHPEEFLDLSENTRLIVFIDELVLYIVCAQIKAWQEAGFRLQCVAVNLSAHTFQQPKLVEMITSVLQKTGLDPHFLGLEITEGIAMQDIDTAVHKLINLSGLGIQIAIDDFGTGFCSLSYLKKFPTNKLKISQHFVNGVATNPQDRAIVSSIITLAQNMKLKVVAEGVETEEQLIFLKQQQCDEMQGYLFSKPLPAEACRKMLVKYSRL